ncbi:hypothetical protein GCM10017788_66250 [Amycolatopsis acidiphila]|nr:hypothetical protein GCM10017788_66250 [Amycolatopsis acidiphila]
MRSWGRLVVSGVASTAADPAWYSEGRADWSEMSFYAQHRGQPRPQNDTWVAACCLAFEVPLATLNVKDYKDFVE